MDGGPAALVPDSLPQMSETRRGRSAREDGGHERKNDDVPFTDPTSPAAHLDAAPPDADFSEVADGWKSGKRAEEVWGDGD